MRCKCLRNGRESSTDKPSLQRCVLCVTQNSKAAPASGAQRLLDLLWKIFQLSNDLRAVVPHVLRDVRCRIAVALNIET